MTGDTGQGARRGRELWLPILGVLLILAGLALARLTALDPDPGLTLAALGGALALGLFLRWLLLPGARRGLVALIRDDPVPGCVTDGTGRLVYANPAACAALALGADTPLRTGLAGADPPVDPDMLLACARAEGHATRETRLAGAAHLLSLRPLGKWMLWRIERLGPDAETAIPLVTLGQDGKVLSMNAAGRRLIGQRPCRADQLVADGPIAEDRIYRLKTAQGPREAHVAALEDRPGCRELAVIPAELPKVGADQSLSELPVAVLKVAGDGTILFATETARQLLGAEKLEGARLPRYMEGLGRSIADWLSEAAEGRGLNRSEFLRLVRDDREAFVQVTLTPTTEAGRRILIAVLNDATELKTLEAQFVQSQKMQAIGQLAGGVAHDFNNLLTAITGHCDLMLLRHDAADPNYADLVQISQNANRAASLVGQLLAFSRKQTLRPSIFDMRETLSDLTHLLNRLVGERTRLILTHDPHLPPVRGDRRQLEQVVMNLVVNARDAMPEGGEIRIETEHVTLEEPLRRDRARLPAGSYVRIRVIDGGQGIPQDQLGKVFEPFFTTKRQGEGTGLGLSTAYGIVKQTGGFIFVESAPGAGTTFSIYVPAHDGPLPQPDPAPREVPRGRLRGRARGNILLVEDEAPVRAFASRALTLRGYKVTEAASAEAALELLSGSGMAVDLFISDVIMPGRDGPSWITEARAQHSGTPVIFMSGYAEEALDRSGPELADAAFLPKPFSLNELTDLVDETLGIDIDTYLPRRKPKPPADGAAEGGAAAEPSSESGTKGSSDAPEGGSAQPKAREAPAS
ncbi:ATP-binding response regulator [Roseivivax sp.]